MIARVVGAVGEIGRRRTYRAIRRAVATSLARDDFRIVHVLVLRTRIELVVEAVDRFALARGMQGFQVSAARRLNRVTRRKGTVFPDRYRPRMLATRAAVHAALTRFTRTIAARPVTWLLAGARRTAATPARPETS